jgi:hypothetical protein
MIVSEGWLLAYEELGSMWTYLPPFTFTVGGSYLRWQFGSREILTEFKFNARRFSDPPFNAYFCKGLGRAWRLFSFHQHNSYQKDFRELTQRCFPWIERQRTIRYCAML